MKEAEHEPHSIDRLRRRDEGAFTELVKEHQRLVLGLGQTLGLSGADLEDAAAETFAAIYQALPRFEGRSAMRTWIYRIALRTMTRARQRQRGRRNEELKAEVADRSARTPHEEAEANDQRRRIWSAVARLDERQAAAIELHYRQGWSVEEIAAALECPPGTVKTLLFRAREKLRDLLSQWEQEP